MGAPWPSLTRSTSSSTPRVRLRPASPMRWRPSRNGKHVVMVNVEPMCWPGPALAKTRAGGRCRLFHGLMVTSRALVAEMVDWARATGFRVQAAGKGTKYLPDYHQVTPDDVWTHYGLSPDAAHAAGA